MKKRYRNYALWTSVIAQGLLVAQLGAALFFDFTITDDTVMKIIMFTDAVLVVLSTLGIVSNPTKPDSKGFNL